MHAYNDSGLTITLFGTPNVTRGGQPLSMGSPLALLALLILWRKRDTITVRDLIEAIHPDHEQALEIANPRKSNEPIGASYFRKHKIVLKDLVDIPASEQISYVNLAQKLVALAKIDVVTFDDGITSSDPVAFQEAIACRNAGPLLDDWQDPIFISEREKREKTYQKFMARLVGRAEPLESSMPPPAPVSHSTLPDAARAPGDTASRTGLNSYLPATVKLIGRVQHVADVLSLLRDHKVVTLLGAGGIGKTQLALQLKEEIETAPSQTFPDGAWFVSLVDLPDPAFIAQHVAAELGLAPGPNPMVVLRNYLQTRRAVLMLDNAEHLRAGCAQFVQALCRNLAGEGIRLLITSRARLELSGLEQIYKVKRLAPHHAEQLFIERAYNQNFSITPADLKIIRTICAKLDGIPLAIELAAARTLDHQSLNEIVTGLYGLLTRGDSTKPLHQQTLQATLQWSYDLLKREESRALFRRLSVLRGWTLDAAQTLCSGDTGDVGNVPDALFDLVSCSLVEVVGKDRDDRTRYRLHEMTREFALAVLASSEQAEVYRDKHCTFYARLADAAAPHLNTPDQKQWLDRLEDDYANIRTALEWCIASGQVEQGLRIATALFRFYGQRGYLADGVKYLTLGEKRQAEYAGGHKALSCAGAIAYRMGDYSRARTLLEASLNVPPPQDAAWIAANSNVNLGLLARATGHYAEARQLCEAAIPLCQAITSLGMHAQCLNILGDVAACEGDFNQAIRYHLDSLPLWEQKGDAYGIGHAYARLGHVVAVLPDYVQATAYFEKGMQVALAIGHQFNIVDCLEGLARLAEAQGDNAEAARQYTAADALRRAIGMVHRGVVTDNKFYML